MPMSQPILRAAHVLQDAMQLRAAEVDFVLRVAPAALRHTPLDQAKMCARRVSQETLHHRLHRLAQHALRGLQTWTLIPVQNAPPAKLGLRRAAEQPRAKSVLSVNMIRTPTRPRHASDALLVSNGTQELQHLLSSTTNMFPVTQS
eukprot:COSAG02_NODE_22907_length_736_cov_0.971743_1_plen_146_part_00